MDATLAPAEVLRAFVEASQAGEPVALATVLAGIPAGPPAGGKLLVNGEGILSASFVPFEALINECIEALRSRRSVTVFYSGSGERLRRAEPGAIEVFIDVSEPQATLLIAGAGHIALPLAKMGSLLGFHVAVIDDRPAFATKERFEDADEVFAAPFVDVLRQYPIGPETYIVIITRGHRHDEESLRAVIDSPAAYVGMIGSKRRSQTVLMHVAEATRASPEKIARVHTPIGLDIGAETPAEIAAAIIAEIVNVRRGGRAASLSDARRLRES